MAEEGEAADGLRFLERESVVVLVVVLAGEALGAGAWAVALLPRLPRPPRGFCGLGMPGVPSCEKKEVS